MLNLDKKKDFPAHLIGWALGTACFLIRLTSSSSSRLLRDSSSRLAPSISASFCFSLMSNASLSWARLSLCSMKLPTSLRGFSEGRGWNGAVLSTCQAQQNDKYQGRRIEAHTHFETPSPSPTLISVSRSQFWILQARESGCPLKSTRFLSVKS